MKTALITGSSAGIGFEIAKRFAKNGYHILMVALPGDELKSAQLKMQELFPTISIKTLGIDLSKIDAPKTTYDWAIYHNKKIDVLVNNAGFGVFGFAHETDPDRVLSMLNLNMICLYQLTDFFLKDMVQRNVGTIINIASNSAFQPIPKMAAYAATKAFVAHYSQALTEELKMLKSDVRILTVYPSAVQDTDFKKTGNMEHVKTFKGLVFTTKKEVADDIWIAFQKKESRLITGRKMRWGRRLQQILPDSINQFFIRREIQE